ncbi:MAG: cysteine--tRNA ligase [Verrucomicrobiales bacterium]
MDLMLFDTMSRKLQAVRPRDGRTLRFYCCGPTVYGPAHIGNFRSFVTQDVFRRVVEAGGTATQHVRNVTDVDDKTIRQSNAEGKSLRAFTQFWLSGFHDDCRALNLLPPHLEPAAAAHIVQQISMIETLIAKGHAYQASDGSVYFKIASYKKYGRLSRLDERELKHGATIAADEYDDKEGVGDFALWKARKPEDGVNFWPSPWGEGRPGWHIECSAMTRQYLGDSFDLHSGGVDLIFPHHENEVAQSECCTGSEMCGHWFHIAHLLVDGRKMAKSLGNLYTLNDLRQLGHEPVAVRYVLLSGHYRQPLTFTLDQVAGAGTALLKLAKARGELRTAAGREASAHPTAIFDTAWQALLDDLNTPKALGGIFAALNEIQPLRLSGQDAGAALDGLAFLLHVLGLVLAEPSQSPVIIPEEIRALADKRWAARIAREWTTSDTLRAQLLALGWAVKDGKEGYELTREGS